ncbi:MAG: ribonuclease HII, partial [Rhizobiaceae bacterium]
QRCVSIAAASIVAKVMRDRMMAVAGTRHPAYGFAVHKGYGTAAHIGAIAAHGPARRLHRMSFRPLRP